MHWQARLPAAFVAIYNFIQDQDTININDIADPMNPEPDA